MKLQYYVLPVYGCTDPEPLVGPFDAYDEMIVEAIAIHAEQKDEDAIFWLKINIKGEPSVASFTDEQLKTDYCLECRVPGCPCCDDTIERDANEQG